MAGASAGADIAGTMTETFSSSPSSSASADVIVVGAGLIGLALARELHRKGFKVAVFDAGEAGRGASWAGAGMLAGTQLDHPGLRPLGAASVELFRTWAPELERETGLTVGYRPSGTLLLAASPLPAAAVQGWQRCAPEQLATLEPELRAGEAGAAGEIWNIPADHSIDNRSLTAALIAAVKRRGIALHEHAPVQAIVPWSEPAGNGGGMAVVSGGTRYSATVVVNAAGAWAGGIEAPFAVPVRPRKGQIIALRSPVGLRHVIEAPNVYLVPRGTPGEPGCVLVGATMEDVGFDQSVSAETTQDLHRRAAAWVPALAGAPVEEAWIGFRPCAADELPILGPTRCPGYWLATAHFRDGILLAPITAKIIARALATGHLTRAVDLTPFLPRRFEPA